MKRAKNGNVREITAVGGGISRDDEFVQLAHSATAASSYNLPGIAAFGKGMIITLFDKDGNAGTNNITLNASPSEDIMGNSTYVIDDDNGWVTVASDGVSTDWQVVGSSKFTVDRDPRVNSQASTATLTVNSDTTDLAILTAQAAALTIAAPTGTPAQGRNLIIRIKDNGTARAITWNAIFRAIGVTLPATTTISKTLYILAKYNDTDSNWDVLAVNEEA